MKTYSLTAVLSVPVVCFACLALSGCRKPVAEAAKEQWHTNIVELWHTNTIEKWRTNTLEVPRTNTVLQVVTNEVTREVPAKLSALEKQAATVGYKHLKAPSLAAGTEALYKAGPFVVEVNARNGATQLPGWDAEALRKEIEATLQSRAIPVAEKSPVRLSLDVTPVWKNDMPRVALVMLRLALNQTVALDRQSDIVNCTGTLWTASASKLVRTGGVSDDLKNAVQEQAENFCQDYLKARETEKTVQGRIPTIPEDFVSAGK